MNGAASSSSNPSGVPGICPAGWHVPGDAEWIQLIDYVVSQGYQNNEAIDAAGNAIKSCRQVSSPLGGGCNTTEHPRWEEDTSSGINHHGFDEFGFSGLPGGYRFPWDAFSLLGYTVYFWSATEHSVSYAWIFNLHYCNGGVYRGEGTMSYGFSVRCLKDNMQTEN